MLKISGRPLPSASSNASMQNLEQIEEAPRQHMTAHPVHHRDQVKKPLRHRNIGGERQRHAVLPLLVSDTVTAIEPTGAVVCIRAARLVVCPIGVYSM